MEEISLREIIEAVWKGKWIIAIVTIIALILGGVGTYIMMPGSYSVVTIVEINYPGIELGKNPDGTQFDIRQIKSPYVIEKALNAAEKARQEMAELKAGNEQLLAEARREKENILREAMNLKDGIVAEAKEKATAETQKSIENARQQIENEKTKAINEMKKEMAELSLLIAEKVIRKEMTGNKQQQEMVNKLIDEIKLN